MRGRNNHNTTNQEGQEEQRKGRKRLGQNKTDKDSHTDQDRNRESRRGPTGQSAKR